MIHIYDSSITLSDGLQDALRAHMEKSVPKFLRPKKFLSEKQIEAQRAFVERAEQRRACVTPRVLEMFDGGQTQTVIARHLNLGKGLVRDILLKAGRLDRRAAA